jgi:cellulose synthase/poly-beta-1,6-N-acetylglucosamine synthase-like glycosyltransferase
MFSTSTDILNLVLAISIAALTFFLALAIYYVIASIRKVHNLINKVESGISKTEELVSLVKDKVKGSSTYIMLFAELIKQLLKFVQSNNWVKKKDSKTESSKKTKK